MDGGIRRKSALFDAEIQVRGGNLVPEIILDGQLDGMRTKGQVIRNGQLITQEVVRSDIA